MKYSQFDKYAPYLKGAALLIAFLTYWRFRNIDLSAVYAYVAQGDVVHSLLFQTVAATRSIVWDFFGLIDRYVTPHSIMLLKFAGFLLIVLDLYIAAALLDYMLAQKFWGFLGMFLAALSPFAVVAAVSGGPASAAVALTLLFLMALYRNQYVYAALLAGVSFAANLPGLIMFLIAVLDLLQNFQDKKKMVGKLLATAAAFFGVIVIVYLYSLYSGNVTVFTVPPGERDLGWALDGVIPLFVANALNLVGVAYLIMRGRYDVYRTHFHTLMLWIASCALCIAWPSTTNLLVALIVSTMLAMFFLQGFSSLWKIKLVSADTFVFFFVILFLFGDLYANNGFLRNVALVDSYEKNEVVGDVISTILKQTDGARLVSNFAPSELSAKIGRRVYMAGGDALPIGGFHDSSAPIIYVARRESGSDVIPPGCKLLLNTSLTQNKKNYTVQVVRCGGNE